MAAKAPCDKAGRRPQAVPIAWLATAAGLGAAVIKDNRRGWRRLKGIIEGTQGVIFQVEPDGQATFNRPVPVGDEAQLAHVAIGDDKAEDKITLAVRENGV